LQQFLEQVKIIFWLETNIRIYVRINLHIFWSSDIIFSSFVLFGQEMKKIFLINIFPPLKY